MKIGIDIDDTLANTKDSFENIIKKYGIPFDGTYNYWWTNTNSHLVVEHLDEIMLYADINKDAKQVIDALIDNGHKLVIVTARNNKYSKNTKKVTYEFLKRNNINIDKIYFNQVSKHKMCTKLNIDLMIDDNIEICKELKKENINHILFGDKVKTWKEVLEYIDREEVNNGQNNN